MAKPLGRKKDGEEYINISGLPEEFPREQKIQLLDAMEALGKPFKGTFDEATELAYNLPKGSETPQGKPPTLEDRIVTEQEAEEAKPKTTASGLADAFATNILPTAIAAAASTANMPVALLERFTHAITPFISDTLNKTFDLEGTAWEQMSTQEMYDKIQYDWLKRERPATAPERVVADVGQAGAESLAALDLAKLMGTAGTAMRRGSRALDPLKSKIAGAAEQTSQVLAEAPVKEMVSGMGAGFGASTVQELVKGTKLPEIAKTLLSLGGAMFTGVTASKLDDLGKLVQKFMRANKMALPDAAAAVIKEADAQGIDVLTSDFDPTTRAGKDRRIARETVPGGARDIRPAQQVQRIDAIERLADDFDVPKNSTLDEQLNEIANDFWAKRDAELTTATNNRDEVFKAMAEIGGEVPTQNTVDLIEDAMAKLIDGGDADMQPFINKLANWKSMVEGKSLAQIEGHRETISKVFSNPELAGLKNDTNQKTINSIYSSLRAEMGEHIKVSGSAGDFRKFEDAMAELSTLSKDFNTKVGIPAIMNSREAPIAAMSSALFNNSPDVVKKIYQRLSPQGQVNARAALITKMLDEATDLGNLSPNQFARKLKNYGGQRGVLFSGENSGHLEGLKKVLEQTSRAEADQLAKEMLPLAGTPGVSRSMAAFIIKHPVTGITTLLGAKAFRGSVLKYIESPSMRDLLLKYDALPATQRAATQGQETLKRMGDTLRGYLIAETGVTEEIDAEQTATTETLTK